MNHILSGDIAERLFDVEALKRGYVPSIPVISSPYDRLLDIGGRIIRVQIKSTLGLSKIKRVDLRHRKRKTSSSKSRSSNYYGKADFYAVYNYATSIWHFIKIQEDTTAALHGNVKENWEVLHD